MTNEERLEKFVAVLVENGKLSLEDSKHVFLREDSNGKYHIEAAGLSAAGAERFKAAMRDAGIPANFKITDHSKAPQN
jgi:polyhydroxyalkanoate synthesis regulator phasin